MTILLILLIVALLTVAGVLIIFYQKLADRPDSQASQILKTDLDNLNRGVSELQQNLKDSLSEKLNASQAQLNNSIQKQFDQSAKIIADVTQRLTKLDETNRRVVDVADELKTLQNVLQNPKQRGVVGEYYLQSVLENVLSPSGFQMQYKFKDGETVDYKELVSSLSLPPEAIAKFTNRKPGYRRFLLKPAKKEA